MKLHVLADLHLEFEEFEVPDTDADLVVFAGDIGKGLQGIELANRCRRPAIYVAGNHEYYREAIPKLTGEMQAAAAENVHFLENGEATVGGVRFLGATLWTDFLLFGPQSVEYSMLAAAEQMNDFRLIRLSPQYNRFTPRAAAVFHRQSRLYLEQKLREPFPGPTVVVTHHAPTMQSCPDRYRDDPLTAAFASNLEELLAAEGPALWIHGHTHHSVDFVCHGTRVVSNQRGYPGDETGFDPGFVVEIGG